MVAIELKDLAPLLMKTERIGSNIIPEHITAILRDGHEENRKRKEMIRLVEADPVLSEQDYMNRNHRERYAMGLKKACFYVRLIQKHKIEDPDLQQYIYSAIQEPLPILVHIKMFIPTLETQGTKEQMDYWLPLAKNFRIFGTYAQTELGHGSNVQGLETTATYDERTQEFIINSPTLTSRKWWPGGLGKTANIAVVYARLLLKNGAQDVGIQAFLVPLRCLETHQPLKGIEVGDIGPKLGFQSIDNGYCAFHHVRIPRQNLLMRFSKVLPDGTFVKPGHSRFVYLTMLQVRVGCIKKCTVTLAQALTIVTRFSVVRVQGKSAEGGKEVQVLDYQNQQRYILPFIGLTFAGKFVEMFTREMLKDLMHSIDVKDVSLADRLAELHAISSGLKAWFAEICCNGIESCRRRCGGLGFLQSSNLSHIYNELVGMCTYEGTFDIMTLQHARYLMKVHAAHGNISSPNASGRPNLTLTHTQTLSVLYCAENNSAMWKPCAVYTMEHFEQMGILLELFGARLYRMLSQLEKCRHLPQNENMVLMSRVSKAHSEYVILKAIVSGFETVSLDHKSTKEAFQQVILLFVLHIIDANMADFLELMCLTAAQSGIIRRLILELLPKVRKNAILFTDSWDFLDFELNSTIGRHDGDIYRAIVKRTADEPLNQSQVHEGFFEYQKPLSRLASL